MKKTETGLIYMFNRNTSTLGRGELQVIQGFSNSSDDYSWGYSLGLSKFADIENPFETTCQSSRSDREYFSEFCDKDTTNIIAFPRAMVIDYDDRYLYVASYVNSRVVAFIRDSATGVLIYKTSVQNTANFLDLKGMQLGIDYPIDLALSGDGGALYVACDSVDKIVVVLLERQGETNFPTSLPTAVPTPDYFPQVDPLSYTNNLTCSTSSCGQKRTNTKKHKAR